jgi:murein tripeptide amidase MpaA
MGRTMAYLNYDEIVSGLQLLCDEYPDHAQLLRLPNLSVESRPVYAVAIGDSRAATTTSAIMVGGMHAREWVPPDALLYLCADLLEARQRGTGLHYGAMSFDKQTVERIFSSFQLIILPCANPDGRVFSQEVDRDWRKNRARLPGHNGALCCGVDLNRNFDIAWDFKKHFAPGKVSASDDPCHKYLYVGPTPASEPETRNIVWLLDQYAGTRWFIDVHSAIPAIFYSWGLDENQVSDKTFNFRNSAHDGKRGIEGDELYREFIDAGDLAEIRRLSQVMQTAVATVNGDSYDVSAAFSLYATSGASDDYAYSRHQVDASKPKVFGFTIECGHDGQPHWPQAEVVMKEVGAALVAFAADASRALQPA